MNKNLIFFIKSGIVLLNILNQQDDFEKIKNNILVKTDKLFYKNIKNGGNKKNFKKIQNNFLKQSITFFRLLKFTKKKKHFFYFLFFNKFILNFLESFFKFKVFLNLKKGSNRVALRSLSYRSFYLKYFKRNLKVGKQIIGILYYSLLLKDSNILVVFLKRVLERLNVKLHKKVFLGIKKLIKDFFKPLFNFLGVLGILFNIKGKIGVSGNAKKRRYYFYVGKHSLTKKTIRVDLKHLPVWTFTGTLGFSFFIFF